MAAASAAAAAAEARSDAALGDEMVAAEAEAAGAKLAPSATLSILVMSASGLVAADSNGKSDPYVTLTVKGAKETHYKKSSIQKKTLNPTWNDAFEFSEIYDADTEVVILVKDDNAVGKIGNVRGKSTPLGQATFTLNLLELPESGAPETHTLALGDVTEGNRKMKFRAQGELVLRVAWVKPTAEELEAAAGVDVDECRARRVRGRG